MAHMSRVWPHSCRQPFTTSSCRQPLRLDSTSKMVPFSACYNFPAAHANRASPHLWVVVVVVVTRPAGTPVGARPRVLGLFEQDPPKMVDRGPCLGLAVGGRRWFWSSAKGGMKGGSWHSVRVGSESREWRLPFSCFFLPWSGGAFCFVRPSPLCL